MKIESEAKRKEAAVPKKVTLAKTLVEQLDWEKAHPEESMYNFKIVFCARALA